MQLLPPNFDDSLSQAVCLFWATKKSKTTKSQGGTRSSVLSAKHLDGFLETTRSVVQQHAGKGIEVVTGGKMLTIPGYFRATKNWDVLIYNHDSLVAAIEFKSMVGSFGNNQNNRIEEVIGLGHDFWTAREHHAFTPPKQLSLTPSSATGATKSGTNPRPPFLGYLMLLELNQESTKSMTPKTGKFGFDAIFNNASYADRYRIMAERLMSERVFTGVAIMMSEKGPGTDGGYSSLSEHTSVHSFFRNLSAHVAALP